MRHGYAKRVDDNQLEIVRLLNQIPGVQCDVVGQPVDLLVGYKGKNFLFEIKRKDKIGRASAYTTKQADWIKDWPGQIRVASSFEEIYSVITGAYKHVDFGTKKTTPTLRQRAGEQDQPQKDPADEG